MKLLVSDLLVFANKLTRLKLIVIYTFSWEKLGSHTRKNPIFLCIKILPLHLQLHEIVHEYSKFATILIFFSPKRAWPELLSPGACCSRNVNLQIWKSFTNTSHIQVIYSNILPFSDEAGCSLRAVEYNGQALCLPGNVASMMAIVQQSSKSSSKAWNWVARLNPWELYTLAWGVRFKLDQRYRVEFILHLHRNDYIEYTPEWYILWSPVV